MKYITTWSIKPENMKAVIKRFQDADTKIPGVTMTRFHAMGTGRGFSTTVAVVGDAEIAAALK